MSYYGTTINDSAVIVVKAGEEIPAPAFLAVGADGKVATAGKNAIGIALPGCDDKATVGDDLDVQIKDIGTWTVGEAVAYGDELAVGAGGKAVKATAKSFIVGIALDIPVITEAKNATRILKSGTFVTMDSEQGLVYSGR